MRNIRTRIIARRVLIVILVLPLALLLAVMWFMPAYVMASGRRQTIADAMQWQAEHYDVSFYDALEKESYPIEGYEDYLLHAEFLENPHATDKYMILSHGYTDNRIGALKYVPIYLELGYNCVIYDLRGHGENERTFTTYGVLEAQDLLCVIEDTRRRFSDISQLGLHGESLGAATTITALKDQPDVDFAVADCGFADIENVLRGAYAAAHVPGILFDITDLGARLRYHYALKNMRPIDSLDDNEIPILFLHGAEDSFILPENSQRMYERTKGIAELHLIPSAEHARSALTDPVLYQEYVTSFLQTIGISGD